MARKCVYLDDVIQELTKLNLEDNFKYIPAKNRINQLETVTVDKCPVTNKDMVVMSGRQAGKQFCMDSYNAGKDSAKQIVNEVLKN